MVRLVRVVELVQDVQIVQVVQVVQAVQVALVVSLDDMRSENIVYIVLTIRLLRCHTCDGHTHGHRKWGSILLREGIKKIIFFRKKS